MAAAGVTATATRGPRFLAPMTSTELQGARSMTSDILSILLEKLKAVRPENAPSLSIEGAQFATLQSLDLDSLDTLQFAMDIETALEMDIEIVNFPDTLTIAQLAERLTVMKAHQRLPGAKVLQARAILA
jgi:acyl carrier protein